MSNQELKTTETNKVIQITNEELEIARQVLEEQDKEQYDSDGYDVNDPFRGAAKMADKKLKQQEEEALKKEVEAEKIALMAERLIRCKAETQEESSSSSSIFTYVKIVGCSLGIAYMVYMNGNLD